MLDAVIYGPGAFNGTYTTKDIATSLEASTGAGMYSQLTGFGVNLV